MSATVAPHDNLGAAQVDTLASAPPPELGGRQGVGRAGGTRWAGVAGSAGVVGRIAVFGLWGLYLLLPIVATVLYSVASVWRNRALPDGYTLRWWTDTLREPRVLDALLRSLGLAAITVVLVAGIVLPPLYWAYVRNPQLRTVMQVAALLPFALPFVVLAYGMKNFAGATALTRPYEASWQLLILGHVALSFPFFLWPVDGALAGCGVRRLHEAAEMSGAGPVQTLLRVVIPNIRTGLLTGAMLCFATSFGEYSIAKVITGSSFETLPVWQVAALSDTRGNPNGVAVMAVFTFVVMFAVSVVIAVAAKGQPVGMVGSGTESRRTRAQRSNP